MTDSNNAVNRMVNGRRQTSLVGMSMQAQEQVTQAAAQAEPTASEFETGNVRIERGISEQIAKHCSLNGYSRDAFIEAVWQRLSFRPELLEEVDRCAKKRHSDRKKQGVRKRAQTMMKEYGE